MPDLSWQDRAACAGMNTNLFYPQKSVNSSTAKKICRHCTVSNECLIYALKTEEDFGIWGGKSERERRKLRKQLGSKLSRI